MASSLALVGVTDFFGAVAVLCRLSPIRLQRQDLLTISNVIVVWKELVDSNEVSSGGLD